MRGKLRRKQSKIQTKLNKTNKKWATDKVRLQVYTYQMSNSINKYYFLFIWNVQNIKFIEIRILTATDVSE